MPRLLLSILMRVAVLCMPACVRTRVVEVPHPVVVKPPACVRRPPPVPAEAMTAADQVDYEVELTVWAWSTWESCKPEGAQP